MYQKIITKYDFICKNVYIYIHIESVYELLSQIYLAHLLNMLKMIAQT